ncbi:chitinase [Cohnella sp. CIP 111063]|uniref:fibronectin type III domain-containing protein n=1 Tax=unclassified Cohnella TaxID=2636738 RepID=UPI000B8C60A3|nr:MULTISPECIES: glycosyl hydrolase family 18 protein [unclassified Cohnella]OXS58823.1 chitinase [Cohnella sp. CIP 111063]PRX71908.1 chitinase [Cohnella sp. SGD-V74]
MYAITHRSLKLGLRIALVVALAFAGLLQSSNVERAAAAAPNNKIIVGYWHNFDNGSTNIRLRDISPDFDVIQVAFAEPIGGPSSGNMAFAPYNATVAEFQSDIDYLQSQGKKVLISIGGANGTIELSTAQAKQTFVTTMKNLVDAYGFDGIDIDLEGSSLSLNGGDTNFRSPTTPKIVNLIAAIQEILGSYNSDFLLTMAPETAYVQGGYIAYGGPWGAYLPVIYALRNDLDYLHVQHYNSGSMTGLDGRSYSQGTADFQVAMAEMLLAGFPIGGNPNNLFPALREDQVLIGLPASPQAAGGGYTTPANVHKALDYLIKGQSYGGTYVLRHAAGYPGLKGLMTWSINWDKYTNFGFSGPHRTYLNQFNGPADLIPPSVPGNLHSTGTTSGSVSLAWDASTDNVGVTGYIVTYDSTNVNVTGTNATINGLAPSTSYTFTVKARDAAGNVSNASIPITVTTDAPPVDPIKPTAPTNLIVTSTTASEIGLSWTASTDNVGVTGYTITYGSSSVSVTGTSATISGLAANTTYTFTVTARDAAGNVSDGTSIQATTATAGTPAWAPNTSYKVNDLVVYQGKTYYCIQAHTSLSGWEPSNVPALWGLQ